MRSKLAIAFLIVGVLSIGAWNSQGQPEKAEGATYEYLVLSDPTEVSGLDNGIKKLNELGAQGWELTGVNKTAGSWARLYFKRARKN